ncbi:hypothetical protein H8356DRAFT_966046, partial [Neocallimastix lanati (nom. inval.)]
NNSDSNPSFDFYLNIKTNIIEDNYNNNSITPRSIKVNKIKAEILIFENNVKKDNNK